VVEAVSAVRNWVKNPTIMDDENAKAIAVRLMLA